MLLFQKLLICAVFLLYVCKSVHPAHCFFLCIACGIHISNLTSWYRFQMKESHSSHGKCFSDSSRSMQPSTIEEEYSVFKIYCSIIMKVIMELISEMQLQFDHVVNVCIVSVSDW